MEMYSVIVLFVPISFAFKFVCNANICWLSHYNPNKDGTFMFKYVQENMSLNIQDLDSSEISYVLLDRIPGTELVVAHSPDVKRLHISRNNRMISLTIMETGIISVECDLNENLRELIITSSPLATISASIINLKNLENLTIQSCLIRQLDLGVFCDLKSLNFLSLSKNKIQSIVSRVKSSPCRLTMTIIILRGNEIRVLNLELFNRCYKLKRLEFQSNQIELVTGRFANKAIESIDLNKNRINQLNLCQWDTPSLEELKLDMNSLLAVPACVDKIKSLEIINMSYNNLTHINYSWLESLKNLKILDIHMNNIDSVTLDSFPKNLGNTGLTGSASKSEDYSNVAGSKLCVKLESNVCSCLNASELA
ncbi:leucine-rich repeat and death domain-containing protein 1-like [Anopheles darlingi]|uniref:leucine-rich repeat and death domain-containing protein 1-like n=1 Tax=Anopheles darlingi TaxID=43151 RepID=UPI00210052FE|nr:leucine-rich repeat and death domain-containing protein 1-like [Anopheles darlingi]